MIWRAVLALSLLALTPAGADAQELRWSEGWQRAHPATYPAISVGFAGALVFDALLTLPEEASVSGPWLFDGAVHDALRASARDDRERAAAFSDALLFALVAWPLFDSLAIAGLARQSSDVAWQLTVITTEVAALDFILSTVIKALVHRERPHGEHCTREDRLHDHHRCGSRGRTRSFYSGHASAGFAQASVVCMAHAHLPLYGDPAADAFACGAALATASIIGMLRMLADRHYATDVLTGALIGLASGLILPYLLHYGWDPRDDTAAAPMATSPLREAPASFSLSGSF